VGESLSPHVVPAQRRALRKEKNQRVRLVRAMGAARAVSRKDRSRIEASGKVTLTRAQRYENKPRRGRELILLHNKDDHEARESNSLTISLYPPMRGKGIH